MSGAIYDDVIRTESKRMEMMVDIYESADQVRDHDFRTETNTLPLQSTGSDRVKIRSSRAAVVCLVVLCVLLLTAVIVLCVYIQTNYTNYTRERDELLTNITNLTEERDELLTKITNLTDERNQLQNNNNQLDNQLNQNCFNGMDGWLYYNFSLYYISSDKKSWTESRRDCTEREADLIIINNREEQNVSKKMSDSAGVWIGLTDSDEEGSWKWVNGSTLTSGFWRSGEPNGRTKENCAVSFPSGWYDYSCNTVFKWICEKNIFK